MSLLDRVRECNNLDPSTLYPFVVDGQRVGWIKPDLAEILARFEQVFRRTDGEITLASALADFESRSSAVSAVIRQLADEGIVTGWRDEIYPIVPDYQAPPLFVVERAAATLLGARSFGVHLLGYVGTGQDMRLWVAQRSDNKPTGPGQKDTLVGGGMAHGMDAQETLIKEAWEEAGMPASLAAGAKPVSEVRFSVQEPQGGAHGQGLDYQFELALPADFVPDNQDGEVAGFALLPVSQVMQEIAETRNYFYEASLAYIDFFVRHGFVTESDPDFGAIVAGLQGNI